MQVSFFVKIMDFGRKRDGLFASSAIIAIGENAVMI